MPEGHTIHRTARLQRALIGDAVVAVDSPQGRFAEGAALLDGRMLVAIDAYGKHLLYTFADDLLLHVHLGLFGKFRMGTDAPPGVRGAVRVRFASTRGWVTLSGPTACDIIDRNEARLLLARIGPDPLRADARPAAVVRAVGRSGVAIGALLMDQSVIAGIGNVYRAELLFRAGLSPWVTGRDLPSSRVLALWQDARRLLRTGEASGRIVTTRPADRAKKTGAVARGEAYYVYHRTDRPCRMCATPIRSAPMAARTVYWCPQCQPGAQPKERA